MEDALLASTPLQVLQQVSAAAVEAVPVLSLSVAYINGTGVSTFHTAGSLVDAPDDTSIYEIGSISKTFTGSVLAGALLFGNVSLSTPVKEIIPELAATGFPEEIDLLSLATHASGLSTAPPELLATVVDVLDPFSNFLEADLLNFLSNYTTPPPPPGPGAFNYSNVGAGLLGYCLERITGLSFEEAVKEVLTGPHVLDMPDTDCFLSAEQQARYVQGYFGQAYLNATVPPALLDSLNLTQLGEYYALPAWNWTGVPIRSAGCLLSTLPDMVKYAQAAMAGACSSGVAPPASCQGSVGLSGTHYGSDAGPGLCLPASEAPVDLLGFAQLPQAIMGPRIPFPLPPLGQNMSGANSLADAEPAQAAAIPLNVTGAPGELAYVGLNWIVEDWSDTASGSRLTWHNGATLTSNAALLLNPELGVGIVMLSNLRGFESGSESPHALLPFLVAERWFCGVAGGEC